MVIVTPVENTPGLPAGSVAAGGDDVAAVEQCDGNGGAPLAGGIGREVDDRGAVLEQAERAARLGLPSEDGAVIRVTSSVLDATLSLAAGGGRAGSSPPARRQEPPPPTRPSAELPVQRLRRRERDEFRLSHRQ